MSVQSIMMFEEGFTRGIRCRYISNSVKLDSYVSSKESILAEIERNMPDLVLMDLDLGGGPQNLDNVISSKSAKIKRS